MTPPGRVTIAEACQIILAQPAPVFFSDTCTLLDVVRAPVRNSSYLIPLAEQFVELAAASPKRLHVVVSDAVTVEWAEHLARTVAEVETELQALQERLRAIREAGTAFPLAPPVALPGDLANLPARLQQPVSRLCDSALLLAVAPECLSRAYTRQAIHRRPGRRGTAMNDCTILEHALCLSSELQTAGFSERCVFSSSNTTDYCEGRALHPELVPEFNAAGLQFTTDLRSARNRLGL